MKIDDRLVSVDADEGLDDLCERRWARGYTGGQVSDEYRETLDQGRGGLGVRRASEVGIDRLVSASDTINYCWVPSAVPLKKSLIKRGR